eukprot:jgi/Bigna1/139984/aug1.53_g14692
MVRSGKWELALSLKDRMFESQINPNHHTYLLCLKVLSIAGEGDDERRDRSGRGYRVGGSNNYLWPRAFDLLNEMRSRAAINPDVAIYAAIVQVLRNHGQDGKVAEVMRLLFDLYKSTIETIEMYYPSGRAGARAYELITQMQERSVKPTLAMMNVAVISCARQYTWSRILDIISAMRSKWVKGNHITYNGALLAMRKGVHWECAEQLVEWMRADGINPDRTTTNLAIGIMREAAPGSVLLEQKETVQNLGGVNEIYSNYTTSFSFLLDKHFPTDAQPRWLKALKVATMRMIMILMMTMTMMMVVVVIMIVIVMVVVVAAGTIIMMKVMRMLREKRMGFTKEMFDRLAQESDHSNNWQLFLRVLSAMHKREFQIDGETYNQGLRLLARNGQWQIGLDLLREMWRHKGGTVGLDFTTDAVVREMLSQADRWEIFIKLVQMGVVKTMSFRLPNGRYNIYRIARNEKYDGDYEREANPNYSELDIVHAERGVYRMGPLDFKLVGLNIPAEPVELAKRLVPIGSLYNDSFDTGFTTARPDHPGQKILGMHNESEYFQELTNAGGPALDMELRQKMEEEEEQERIKEEEEMRHRRLIAEDGGNLANQNDEKSEEVYAGGYDGGEMMDLEDFARSPATGGETMPARPTSSAWDQSPADVLGG